MSKSKWLTGKEIVENWDIKNFDLLNLVRKGLQPHDDLGRPIPPPDVSKKNPL